MLRGLWKLTWIEIKVFLREPLGAVGTIAVPVLLFLVLGKILGRGAALPSLGASRFVRVGLPVFASVLISLSAVLSLPLRPQTILSAHVIAKLIFTASTLALMILAGKRYDPVGVAVPLFSFAIALVIATWSILSIGFVIASIVPTARFAQPIGAVILYPMIGICGLFVPIAALPPAVRGVTRVLPLTYVVSLLQGIWSGEAWSAHLGDLAALVVVFVVCTTVSAKIFRWE
jgi:ABC-2 type transport system permease protein